MCLAAAVVVVVSLHCHSHQLAHHLQLLLSNTNMLLTEQQAVS